ncbi:MAG: hypothetical protein M3121_03365, partial [Chloroflexota bacterium]|nr:hypothetical protein [Chloroflexota bacterium]
IDIAERHDYACDKSDSLSQIYVSDVGRTGAVVFVAMPSILVYFASVTRLILNWRTGTGE